MKKGFIYIQHFYCVHDSPTQTTNPHTTRTFTPITHISFALDQAKHRQHTCITVPFQILLQIDDFMQKRRHSSAFKME